MLTNVFLFNFIVWSCFEVKIEGKKTFDYRLKCSKDFFKKNGSLITFGVGRNAVLLVKLFKTVIIWLRHFFFFNNKSEFYPFGQMHWSSPTPTHAF